MNNIDLSIRLKELRKTCNFSQEYIASYLNISRQAYSHYETGRNTPPPDILIKLAQLYHLPASSFLSLCSPQFASLSTPQQDYAYLDGFLDFFTLPDNNNKYLHLTKEEKLLIYFYQQLSSDDQSDLLEILKIRTRRHLLSSEQNRVGGK